MHGNQPKIKGGQASAGVSMQGDWGWLQTQTQRRQVQPERTEKSTHSANNSARPRNNSVRPSQQSAPPHDTQQCMIKQQFSPSPKDFSLALSTNTTSSMFVCSESHWENGSVSHIWELFNSPWTEDVQPGTLHTEQQSLCLAAGLREEFRLAGVLQWAQKCTFSAHACSWGCQGWLPWSPQETKAPGASQSVVSSTHGKLTGRSWFQ